VEEVALGQLVVRYCHHFAVLHINLHVNSTIIVRTSGQARPGDLQSGAVQVLGSVDKEVFYILIVVCFFIPHVLRAVRMNYELNKLIGNADTVRFIKSRRISWLGHVMWMDDKRTPKRILRYKPIGTRIRGRPRKRWIAGIEEELQIMVVRQWRKQCEERAEWKKITEKAKTHSGL
jgi:hypothetical protein